MPRFSVETASRGGREFRALSKRISEVGRRDLRQKLQREIRVAGRPVLGELRDAARGIPARGPKSRGTRALMARNTRLNARAAGVRFRVAPLPGDRRGLPPLYEGLRPWRKPLFGNRDRWYSQGASPWFYPTAMRSEPRFRAACIRVIDEVIDELGG